MHPAPIGDRIFGVAARRRPHDAVARRDALHVAADRFDLAGTLETEPCPGAADRAVLVAEADQEIGAIEARGAHADQDLVRLGRGLLHVANLDAVLTNDCGFHVRTPVGKGSGTRGSGRATQPTRSRALREMFRDARCALHRPPRVTNRAARDSVSHEMILTSYKSRRANMGAMPESDAASDPDQKAVAQRRDHCRGEPRITNMRMIPLKALSVAFAALMAAATPALAEDGVSADKIIFGQAAALDGPASALGQGMKLGLEAAFAEANKAGGGQGRKLDLKSVDDGYEPTRSIEAVKKLLGEDKVFALAGAVGTPPAAATLPIATPPPPPLLAPSTAAHPLPDP